MAKHAPRRDNFRNGTSLPRSTGGGSHTREPQRNCHYRPPVWSARQNHRGLPLPLGRLGRVGRPGPRPAGRSNQALGSGPSSQKTVATESAAQNACVTLCVRSCRASSRRHASCTMAGRKPLWSSKLSSRATVCWCTANRAASCDMPSRTRMAKVMAWHLASKDLQPGEKHITRTKRGGGGRPSLKWLAVSPAAVRSSRPSGVSLAWGARGHNSDTLPVKSRPGIWWEAPPFPA